MLFIGVGNDWEAFGISLDKIDQTKNLIALVNDRHIFPYVCYLQWLPSYGKMTLEREGREAMRLADQNIQWHPGFYAGIELELRAYDLIFDQEHQVTRGALSFDLLIIKKHTDEKIDNEIGEYFRKHNVVEFKSPDDELSIDVYFKVQAYAGLYKASGETVNEIPANEVTVSLFRDIYPREMVEQLKALGAEVTNRHGGIYEIRNAGLFPTQLIVTGELEPENHSILRVLSNRVTRADVEAFLTNTKKMRSAGEIARLDAILQVSASANEAIYDAIYKEESDMCQALREIMKEDFAKAEARGEARGKDTAQIESIRNLMESTKWSAQQAMDALKIPTSKQANYSAQL